ncbi:MAG TPA: carbon monoxide dehydrogenase subunit G [Bryobacteraceae bacterium]|nr:carbon monoxide dehydrogenase subunit G [Bryobacteraceae bacterium]
MKIAGTYKLDTPQERAYQLLQDPVVLARCMPGCDSLEKTGENEYAMRMKLLIASLSGLFEGKVKLTDQEPPNRFRMRVDGSGKIGFMKGEGVISLAPEGTGTLLSYDGDVNLGGTMAAVGQRLVDTTSKMMLKRFFEKLSQEAKTASAS